MQGLLPGISSPWIKGPIVSAVWTVGLIVVMRVTYIRLKRLTGRIRTHLDDIILRAPGVPLVRGRYRDSIPDKES